MLAVAAFLFSSVSPATAVVFCAAACGSHCIGFASPTTVHQIFFHTSSDALQGDADCGKPHTCIHAMQKAAPVSLSIHRNGDMWHIQHSLDKNKKPGRYFLHAGIVVLAIGQSGQIRPLMIFWRGRIYAPLFHQRITPSASPARESGWQ